MKESFWGILIIILGIFGIVCINLFQNVTVDNDKVYYVLKESTEAAAHDSIDLSYYRLGGTLRIVEEKFVENLTRRFSENITAGSYTISVQNINELPPLMSIKVRSGVTSLKDETYDITNRIDGIIETKYKLSEVLDFLGITEEEWNEINNKNKEALKNGVCGVTFINDNDLECITGDLRFDGLDTDDLKESVCIGQQIDNVKATAKYSVCECGTWQQKEDTLTASPVYVNNNGIGEYVYTYKIQKTGDIRNIDETIIKRVRADVCTTGIEIYVPKDLTEKEPSSDNSKYEKCDPTTGIRIPEGVEVVLHSNYIPENATNRQIAWTPGNATLLSFGSFSVTQPSTVKGFSKVLIKGKLSGTEAESTTMTATTTLNQSAVCPIKVWDGSVDSVKCEDINTQVGYKTTLKSSYEPYNATKTSFTYKIENSSLVSDFNEKTGAFTAKSSGTTTYTVTFENGKTATCKLNINKYVELTSSGDYAGGGSSGVWIVEDANGNRLTFSSKSAALAGATKLSGDITVYVSNGWGTNKYGEGKVTYDSTGTYSGVIHTTNDGTVGLYGDTYTEYDKNNNVILTNKQNPDVYNAGTNWVNTSSKKESVKTSDNSAYWSSNSSKTTTVTNTIQGGQVKEHVTTTKNADGTTSVTKTYDYGNVKGASEDQYNVKRWLPW